MPIKIRFPNRFITAKPESGFFFDSIETRLLSGTLLSLPILRRRASHRLSKCFCEITGTGKATLQCDFRHTKPWIFQERHTPGNTVFGQIGNRRLIQVLFKDGTAAASAHKAGCSDLLERNPACIFLLNESHHLMHCFQTLSVIRLLDFVALPCLFP